MKFLGVDHSVVMVLGGSSYFCPSATPVKNVETSEEFSRFPFELENRNLFTEIYEIFPEYSEMALPFVMFDPSRKTAEQAIFLQELYERYHFFGLKTCTTYIQSFVRDMDTVGRPIVEFAERHDLPILFHSSYYKNDPWAPLADILAFAESHPAIRVCLAHNARFHRPSLERAAGLQNCFVDLSAFDIHCLLARRGDQAIPPPEERVQADYNNPALVMKKMVTDYPTTIIWGSDTPANYDIEKYCDAAGNVVDVDLRSVFDGEVKLLCSLNRQEIDFVAHRNTARFLFGEDVSL
jgi:predicted TIM-barrel fold metal-dependent hydrolase